VKMYLLCFSTLMLISGCSTRLADLSIISSRNVEMSPDYELVERNVKSSDMVTVVLGVSFGGANIEEAVEKAMDKVGGGDYMTNVIIYDTSYSILGLYGRHGITVKGDVWRKKK